MFHRKIVTGMVFFCFCNWALLAQTGVGSGVEKGPVPSVDSSSSTGGGMEGLSLGAEMMKKREKHLAENTFTEKELAYREWTRLSRARAGGKSERDIFLMHEGAAIHYGIYKKVEDFNTWMTVYNGVILTNTPAFDFMNEWDYCYSSPFEALRSYRHALANCDAREILEHSDPSFVAYLKRVKKWNLLATPSTYPDDGMTKVIPLLAGACVMDGKEYTMIFNRREFPSNSKLNMISFHWNFFVFLNGEYQLSDAPAYSQFGNMYMQMKFGDVYSCGQYETLAEKLKSTDVPPQFYMIND